MKKLISYFVISLAFILSVGCERSTLFLDGIVVDMKLNLKTEQLSCVDDDTKVVPDDMIEGVGNDYMVADFWLFEYNTNGLLVGKPRYYQEVSDEMKVSVLCPGSEQGEYTCYIIANTHNPSLLAEIGDYSTDSALRKASKKISSYDDLWQIDESEGVCDLLMSGSVKIGHNTEKVLDCSLRRNVAKLTLTITNDEDAQITINTLQWKNVPDRMFYADVMYDGAPTPSPSELESGFVNLGVETIDLSVGENDEFTYYLPRNMRGDVVAAASTSDKNKYAPSTATYLEVMATNNNTGTSLRYRFYLGQNMIDNFDVEPNCHYVLPINFTGKGAETDSRVEDLGLIHLADANSYMIHPLSTSAQTMYTIPVVHRINQFWGSELGQQSRENEYLRYMISENTEWYAEIIWQDVPDKVLVLCDQKGQEFDNGIFSAKGDALLYFRPTQTAYKKPCNVVLGVKRKDATEDEGYMWSWHIWITEYNPDQKAQNWIDGIYRYSVDGGAIHRYADWDSSLTNKYIMDRNLGARSAKREDKLINNAGMGYQFGRKDPFPMVKNYPLYDKDGNRITFNGTSYEDPIEKQKGPAWIYQSIRNPTCFYWVSSTAEGDWVNENIVWSYIWNDLGKNTTGKSFFDPCPPGWKVPEKSVTWQHLTEEMVTGEWGSRETTLGWEFYMGEKGDSETVFFPIAGWRGMSNGSLGYNESTSTTNYIFTRNWISVPKNSKSGSYIHTGRHNNASQGYTIWVETNQANYRAYGHSVRCIQE